MYLPFPKRRGHSEKNSVLSQKLLPGNIHDDANTDLSYKRPHKLQQAYEL